MPQLRHHAMRLFIQPFLVIVFLIFATSAPLASEDNIQLETIKASLRHQWDKPEQPLTIPTIAVIENYAIADWIQNDKGGRALLKQREGNWETLLCGDVRLTDVTTLKQAGVHHEIASELANLIRHKESFLNDKERSTIDFYSGIVEIHHGHHHAH